MSKPSYYTMLTRDKTRKESAPTTLAFTKEEKKRSSKAIRSLEARLRKRMKVIKT